MCYSSPSAGLFDGNKLSFDLSIVFLKFSFNNKTRYENDIFLCYGNDVTEMTIILKAI